MKTSATRRTYSCPSTITATSTVTRPITLCHERLRVQLQHDYSHIHDHIHMHTHTQDSRPDHNRKTGYYWLRNSICASHTRTDVQFADYYSMACVTVPMTAFTMPYTSTDSDYTLEWARPNGVRSWWHTDDTALSFSPQKTARSQVGTHTVSSTKNQNIAHNVFKFLFTKIWFSRAKRTTKTASWQRHCVLLFFVSFFANLIPCD